jgi:hypothetical protein
VIWLPVREAKINLFFQQYCWKGPTFGVGVNVIFEGAYATQKTRFQIHQ